MTTNNVPAFVSVMNRLAEMNLADTNPGLIKKIFLYDHPPISERVERARRWGEE
jgi:Zn-dependent protease with chaperone function